MSRKDYEKIAQALKDSKPVSYGSTFVENSLVNLKYDASLGTWKSTVEILVMTLQHDNPRFNRSRFLHACDYN